MHHPFSMGHIKHLIDLVDPECKEVKEVAASFTHPEEAYLYVRDEIRFKPHVPGTAPSESIKNGVASCFGKAVLLCSIYRAMGASEKQVAIAMAEVRHKGLRLPHAWVMLYWKDRVHHLDPTKMLGAFGFDQLTDGDYHTKFVNKQVCTFNDTGLLSVK